MQTSVDGRAIRRARSTLGLTQHQLASAIGIAGGERVSEWERGASQPRARMLPRMAEVLHVDPLELLLLPRGVDLRALRLVAGRTAPEVALAVNVSVHTYLRWEIGERLPLTERRTLVGLSRQLCAPMRDVLDALGRTQVDDH